MLLADKIFNLDMSKRPLPPITEPAKKIPRIEVKCTKCGHMGSEKAHECVTEIKSDEWTQLKRKNKIEEKQYCVQTDKYSGYEWYYGLALHREDGPAVFDGRTRLTQHYKNGILQNPPDKPAVYYSKPNSEDPDESKCMIYCKDGVLHREDGPALIKGSHQEWWMDGIRHRENEPALINDTRKEWWVNGIRHRLNGPAIESTDEVAYFENGLVHRDTDWAYKREKTYAWFDKGTFIKSEKR